MNSLRDQLLKVGLVTEQQAKQAAQQEQQRQFRNRPPKNPSSRPGQGADQRRGSNGPGGQDRGSNTGAGPNAGYRNSGPNSGYGQNAVQRNAGGRPDAGSSAGANAGSNTGPHSGAPSGHRAGFAGGGAPGGTARTTPLSPALAAQQAQAAKVARDLELNRKREEKAKRRARIAEIEQIIEQNRAPRLETEDYYSFIDGKKIRRMSVDPQRREQLTSGVLAIVRYKGHYAVVPKATAERVRERDENMVVPVVQPTAASTETTDEAYKDFVVPDDLMW